MLQVTLSQLRSHPRRFIAITLAVLLAVAFLSATLIVNASSKASLRASVGESYAGADLVVAGTGRQPLSREQADAAAASPVVAERYALQALYPQATVGTATVAAVLRNHAPVAALEPQALVSGSWPGTDTAFVIDAATAARQHLTLGSPVRLSLDTPAGTPPGRSGPVLAGTISGIMAATQDPQQTGLAQFVGTTAAVGTLSEAPSYQLLSLLLAPEVSVPQAKAALAAELALPESRILTAEEQTTAQVASLTDDQDALTVVLLAFAGVALLVAALVVANTFSVLVAQRTRELALLRCLGASRRQIHRSVLLEALLVGFLASVLGVAVAVAGMAAVVGVLRGDASFAFATLAVPPSAVGVGLLVGTALTVLAALVPARAATAVAPLAAMRPVEEGTLRTPAGRLRLSIGVALLLCGGVGLVVGAVTGQLGLALPAGAASFVGFLLAASLFVPRLVALAGTLARPAGVPGRLAGTNAVRNPGRTTATASALLIGVTLVTMMMTGAATARQAFETSLDAHFPVDMVAAFPANGEPRGGAPTTGPSAAELAAAGQVAGVTHLVVPQAVGTVQLADLTLPVYGISAADATAMLRNPANRPQGSGVVLPAGLDASSGALTLSDGAPTTVPLSQATTHDFPALLSLAQHDGAAPAAVPDAPALVWFSTAPGLSSAELMTTRAEIAAALHLDEYQVSGGVVEKAMFGQLIDLLLLVVTALLAVAVVIALIGVANTLSLSVLERTRENSLLRALGLTRGQLRGMLALEALLMAGVAAVLGCTLGVLYGWAGAQAALGTFATVTAVVPWGQLLLVVGVAAGAGLLASVLPARRAARLSPVAGLAVD